MFGASNIFSAFTAGWCLGIGFALVMSKSYKGGAICLGLGVLNAVLMFM